ncbi:hypothetical protein [Caulobacter sp. CCG-8]|uniref:hypothetical protein n=1 Tax=Caulobacter sp. CCG-8 TaxID=3127958 RepID=UPI00307D0392
MKAYAIFPAFELYGDDVPAERTQASISLIAKMTFDSLRSGGDVFQFVVDWRDPGAAADAGHFHEDLAEPHLIPLLSEEDLLDRIRRSIDPNAVCAGTVRSAATCRAVTFGWDGQAFICLRHEDKAPVSPDATLAVVSSEPDLFTETDYFDGWIRD